MTELPASLAHRIHKKVLRHAAKIQT